jgi:hypothetical protein
MHGPTPGAAAPEMRPLTERALTGWLQMLPRRVCPARRRHAAHAAYCCINTCHQSYMELCYDVTDSRLASVTWMQVGIVPSPLCLGDTLRLRAGLHV